VASGLTPERVPGVEAIDWSAPWLADWSTVGQPLAQRIASGMPQHEALNTHDTHDTHNTPKAHPKPPVRFVAQTDLPANQAYEAFIFENHCVPTREGLHDFFNALCWMHFPLTKLRLNALQGQAIAQAGVGAVRGALRDAATVFDENAALLQAPDVLWQALAERRWHAAFVDMRAVWQQARWWTFGHAALEKLVQPYKSITVHVWRVPQHLADLPAIDAWLAQDLQADKLAAKPFCPMPVLGVPGWWPANEAPSFYADAAVFRPVRRPSPVMPQ
jgi:hypothetical protein